MQSTTKTTNGEEQNDDEEKEASVPTKQRNKLLAIMTNSKESQIGEETVRPFSGYLSFEDWLFNGEVEEECLCGLTKSAVKKFGTLYNTQVQPWTCSEPGCKFFLCSVSAACRKTAVLAHEWKHTAMRLTNFSEPKTEWFFFFKFFSTVGVLLKRKKKRPNGQQLIIPGMHLCRPAS